MSTVIIETTATKVAEEVKAALENPGSGAFGWARAELGWAIGTFCRAAISIAVSRLLWGYVNANPRAKQIYERAEALLVNGKQERPYSRPSGFAGSYGTTGQGTRGGEERPFTQHDHARSNTQGADAPQGALYKGMAGEYALYHHSTKYDSQWWPCPILYKHPCETCTFFVADRSGRGWCAANEKLKMVLAGTADNQDLYELRDFIRSMG